MKAFDAIKLFGKTTAGIGVYLFFIVFAILYSPGISSAGLGITPMA